MHDADRLAGLGDEERGDLRRIDDFHGLAGKLIGAHGLGLAGRDILVPVNLCPIAVAGLIWAGVRPVFHDVDPDSGNTGAVTPVRTYQTSTGQYCREYTQTITIGGEKHKSYGTACRESDGSWKIVN